MLENFISRLKKNLFKHLEMEKYLDKCVTAVRQGNYSSDF